jgi:hypothetical protein
MEGLPSARQHSAGGNFGLAVVVSVILLGVASQAMAQTAQAAQAATGLRIVVIAGEDAVNIIQQKTAVAPIVEVRDRNNLPVSGVAVTFSVGGQGASFGGGLSTLTVTTNAAGQATAAGLTPTATGAIQINATALVQGQTVTATITQTNFATVAQATQAASAAGGGTGSGGGTGGAAGGGAAGGGGGLSGAALGGIIGGVAAGGALVATQVGGGGDDSPTTTTSTTGTPTTGTTTTTPTTPAPAPTPTPTPTTTVFNGPFSGTITVTASFNVGTTFNCTYTYAVTGGNLRITLQTRSDGTVGGTGDATSTITVSSINCSIPIPGVTTGQSGPFPFNGPISGTTGSIRFTQDQSQTIPVEGAGTVSARNTETFTGSLSGGVITGTITSTHSVSFSGAGISFTANGSGTFPVTLR